jgi:hypothetical protein
MATELRSSESELGEPKVDEPMPSEPIASHGMTGEPAVTETAPRTQAGPQAGPDIGADAALVLAAVARMQAADHEARETLARLRTGLGEMADAIEQAKAHVAQADAQAYAHDGIAKIVDIAAMLDGFEHLVDGLIAVATGRADDAPPPDPAQLAMELSEPAEGAALQVTQAAAEAAAAMFADADRVPTVSAVVSRLDPDQAVQPAATEAPEGAFTYAAAPSVEMLKSLVEALNASIPDEPFEDEPQAESPVDDAAAKAMAHDVIQAFAWELTRGDVKGAPEEAAPEAAAETAVAETAAAETALTEAAEAAIQQVAETAPTEAPEEFAALAQEFAQEFAEAAPVEQAAQDIPAVEEVLAAPDIQAQDVQLVEAPEAEAIEDTEPLVFDVVVEFDPAEPRPEAHAEAIAPELVEAPAPSSTAEPAETIELAAVAGSDNDVHALAVADVLTVEAEAPAAETTPAEAVVMPEPESVVEAAIDTAEAPAEIARVETEQPAAELAAEPVAAEPIHAEEMPAEAASAELAADAPPAEAAPAEVFAVEAAPVETADAESAPIEDAAPIETASFESTAIEYTLADLPEMPHEALFDDVIVAEQHSAEPEQHAVVEPIVTEQIAEPATEAEPTVAAVPEPAAEVMQVVAAEQSVLVVTEPAAEAPAEAAMIEAPPAVAGVAASTSGDVIVYEVELLARFERMEALAILPPELGTAVIFQPRDGQAAKEASKAAEVIAPESSPLEAIAEPAAEAAPSPEAAADDADQAAVFKLPADLLPVVDLGIAPEPEPAEPEPAALEAAVETAPEAATAVAQPAEETAVTEMAAAEAAGMPEPSVAEGPAEAIAAAEAAVADEPVLETIATPEPVVAEEPVAEAIATPEPAVAPEPVAEAAAEPAVEIVAEAVPEAVAVAEPVAEIAAAPEAAVEPVMEAAEPEALAEPEPQPAATAEAAAVEFAIVEPVAVDAVDAEPAVAEAAPQPPDDSAAEPQAVDLDAEFDPDNFLFDDETDQADMPAAAAAEVASNGHAAAAARPAIGKAAEPPKPAPPADPLIPIKSMTPEERIALFS